MARNFRRNRREEQREYVDFEGTGHKNLLPGVTDRQGAGYGERNE
ncbi:hypothetical protein Pan153_04460 [Gimesia panareensis]|uniref:Uncharacterized protein n=1 Tax=Gimesia panareensis TaxID=2527978 RepID=A0A517Q0N4_9PLAN|nr:hypothetical protein Enr10x_04790 [Gimesia panareensis]QDV15827.1 hypothetical protein Pan153_04460 [Gimesia panareensis]